MSMNMIAVLRYEDQEDTLPQKVLLVQGIDSTARLDQEVQDWKNNNGYYDEDSCTEDMPDKEIIEKLGYTVLEVPYMTSDPQNGLCQV